MIFDSQAPEKREGNIMNFDFRIVAMTILGRVPMIRILPSQLLLLVAKQTLTKRSGNRIRAGRFQADAVMSTLKKNHKTPIIQFYTRSLDGQELL